MRYDDIFEKDITCYTNAEIIARAKELRESTRQVKRKNKAEKKPKEKKATADDILAQAAKKAKEKS